MWVTVESLPNPRQEWLQTHRSQSQADWLQQGAIPRRGEKSLSSVSETNLGHHETGLVLIASLHVNYADNHQSRCSRQTNVPPAGPSSAPSNSQETAGVARHGLDYLGGPSRSHGCPQRGRRTDEPQKRGPRKTPGCWHGRGGPEQGPELWTLRGRGRCPCSPSRARPPTPASGGEAAFGSARCPSRHRN